MRFFVEQKKSYRNGFRNAVGGTGVFEFCKQSQKCSVDTFKSQKQSHMYVSILPKLEYMAEQVLVFAFENDWFVLSVVSGTSKQLV